MSVHRFEKSAAPCATAANSQSIEAFLSEIADLARSIEPQVAVLLDRGDPCAPIKPWTRGRRRGLKVCLNMLQYVRDDVARGHIEQRLDNAVVHIMYELAQADEADDRLLNGG